MVSSRFAALGFSVQTDADLDRMVRTVMEEAEPIVRPGGGLTFVCGTTSRAALAVHTEADSTVSCVTPFLSTQERTPVRIAGTVANPECVHCSLLLADLWGPDGALRIGFCTPHFELWSNALVAGAAVEIGLAAIAESIVRVADDAVAGIVVEPFQPAAAGSAPVPMAVICGVVRSHLMRHNELGGGAFEWAELDVGGLTVEIAVDPSELEIPFSTGATVSGRFFLSGPVWNLLEE